MPSNSVLSGGVSRRSFLRGSVAASAALALAGCGQAAQSASSDAERLVQRERFQRLERPREDLLCA